MSRNKKSSVVNLGCRLNGYESSVIDGILQQEGIEDTIVINSCAVTKEAERKSRQEVRRLKKLFPEKKIVVTGCAAQINPEQFSKMQEVDKVIGNSFKTDVSFYRGLKTEVKSLDYQIANEEKILVNDIMSITETASHIFTDKQDRSRAFLQIQNGCNHRCTFCIIAYGRGNSRSVPVAQIIDSVNYLIEKDGYNEVVLTGVDITDYGSNLPASPKLGALCKRILANTSLKRLRLSSIDVAEVDDDILDLLANEPRFMPYFHISLQSGNDMILKRMKRRHLRDDVFKFLEKARNLRPDIGFGADIICGFPTETDEMFEDTKNLVREAGIPYLHAFTYSPRDGTPAARMPQVDQKAAKNRTNELIAIADDNLQKFLATMINRDFDVIIEEKGVARCENFAKVEIANYDKIKETIQVGSIARCKILSVGTGVLVGDVCQ